MNGPLPKKRGAPRMGPNPPARPQDGPGLAHAAAQRNRLLDLQLLAPVMKAIDGRLSRDGRAVVALDGMCGAGKTTLAALLGQRYATAPIHMDDFFLPPTLRTPQRLAAPGGNVHYERFLDEVLMALASGGEVRYHARARNGDRGKLLPSSRLCRDVPAAAGAARICKRG